MAQEHLVLDDIKIPDKIQEAILNPLVNLKKDDIRVHNTLYHILKTQLFSGDDVTQPPKIYSYTME
jgi:hypothetical protein